MFKNLFISNRVNLHNSVVFNTFNSCTWIQQSPILKQAINQANKNGENEQNKRMPKLQNSNIVSLRKLKANINRFYNPAATSKQS